MPAVPTVRAKSRLALMHAAILLTTGGCDQFNRVEFDATIRSPAFAEDGPVVLFDAGHHNHHSLNGSYRPFAKLLRNDGFSFSMLNGPVLAETLSPANILVVVTALADTATNAEPAFTQAEIAAVVNWVRGGGSLLLVTEHYPFANSVEGLANAVGIEVARA